MSVESSMPQDGAAAIKHGPKPACHPLDYRISVESYATIASSPGYIVRDQGLDLATTDGARVASAGLGYKSPMEHVHSSVRDQRRMEATDGVLGCQDTAVSIEVAY